MDHALTSWHRALIADGYSPRTTSARLGVVEIVAFLAARSYAPWSRRTYLQHLTAWGTWIGQPDLTAGIRRPPAPYAHPDPVPEGELQRLLIHLHDRPREYAWVVLGAYAGLRAGEVARLHSASPKTTAGYAAVADDAARTAVDLIPGATPDHHRRSNRDDRSAVVLRT